MRSPMPCTRHGRTNMPCTALARQSSLFPRRSERTALLKTVVAYSASAHMDQHDSTKTKIDLRVIDRSTSLRILGVLICKDVVIWFISLCKAMVIWSEQLLREIGTTSLGHLVCLVLTFFQKQGEAQKKKVEKKFCLNEAAHALRCPGVY